MGAVEGVDRSVAVGLIHEQKTEVPAEMLNVDRVGVCDEVFAIHVELDGGPERNSR